MNRLELKDVSTHYGTSHILFDVSLAVDEGEVVCRARLGGVLRHYERRSAA